MLECKTHCCFLPKKFGFLNFGKSSNVTNLGFKKRPRNDQNTEREKEKKRDILLGRRPWEGGEKEPLFSFLQGTVQEQKSKMRWLLKSENTFAKL